ncbi:MAG: hypothetical protein P8014_18760 [Acidihalobacter sp.]|uniref:hypothetical protein n=1 Tax=Acidihalobacter sp. TaxID=1872108 RepID=UPI00307D5CC2
MKVADMFYFLQTVSELEDIIEFSNRLRCHGSKRFIDAMKLAIKGPLFRAGAEGVPAHKSRNYLFELIVAARFVESGQLVDLSKPTDVVVVDLNLAVECKRVSSDSKVEKRVKAAIEQIERSGEKYREGAIFVDITSIFESSHSVNIVDETDILNAFSPPSDSEQLTTLFGSKVWHDVGQPIDAMKAKIGGLLTDKVPYVVFCYNYVGFHRSLFHERAVTGTCSYPLVKANFLNGLAWFAISKTLGVSLDLEV